MLSPTAQVPKCPSSLVFTSLTAHEMLVQVTTAPSHPFFVRLKCLITNGPPSPLTSPLKFTSVKWVRRVVLHRVFLHRLHPRMAEWKGIMFACFTTLKSWKFHFVSPTRLDIIQVIRLFVPGLLSVKPFLVSFL